MSEDNEQKIYFEPSTMETIDRSVFEYVKNLELFADTNKGRKRVPIVWGTSERAFLTKNNKEARDKQGALIFPVISIKRTSVQKPSPSTGIFIGNIPGVNDAQGGSVMITKVINQEKSSNFAKSTSLQKTNQQNYPLQNNKIVYKTVSIPMPVNLEMMYEINIRTEFQQQANELMLPFITNPGTVRAISLTHGEHRYEGFIEGNFQAQNNLDSYSGEERKFESKVALKVIGYVVGKEGNQEKPFYTVRENAVEVKLPKEKVITDPKELEKYL